MQLLESELVMFSEFSDLCFDCDYIVMIYTWLIFFLCLISCVLILFICHEMLVVNLFCV